MEAIKISKDYPVVFSVQGNYHDENNIYISVENLYEIWKLYIGKSVQFKGYDEMIITEVTVQGDFLFIKTISN